MNLFSTEEKLKVADCEVVMAGGEARVRLLLMKIPLVAAITGIV